MRGLVGPLSKFRNCSLLVALSGRVKELWAFPGILHLSGNSPPVERARSSDATLPKLSHGACISLHSAGAHRCPAEFMAFTARASPKSSRLVEYWVNDRPESATTRSDLGRLLSWRCTLSILFECDCHSELSQIQESSLNSLKFAILQILPGPFLNVT